MKRPRRNLKRLSESLQSTSRLKFEIPKGYEDMIPEFMELEKDEKFKGKIEKLVERTLKKERKEKTETKSEQKSDNL